MSKLKEKKTKDNNNYKQFHICWFSLCSYIFIHIIFEKKVLGVLINNLTC